MVASS